MTAATENLNKWLFYFDRFNNHEISAKLDQALCEATEEKMVEVQEASDLSWIEVRPNMPLPSQDLITNPFTVQVYATRCRCANAMPSDTQMELYDGVLPCTGQPETDIRRSASVSHTVSFLEDDLTRVFHYRYRNLEKAVEDLSQLLEEPIEAETVKDLRKRMMDKTVSRFNRITKPWTNHDLSQVYVQKRHEILLNDTAAQLAEGKWEWVTPLDA